MPPVGNSWIHQCQQDSFTCFTYMFSCYVDFHVTLVLTCYVKYLLKHISGVCKSNESESVSVLCYELVFHHKWGGCTVFHGGCAVFWGGCAVFQGRCTVFCCRTALTYKLCILLLLDYFHPRNDGFVSCLPFTEHVQTLFTLN